MPNLPPSNSLPRWVDARKLAGQGAVLAGDIPPDQLSRVGEAVDALAGAVKVELQFGIEGGGVRTLHGTVLAQVELVCQRCLTPLAHAVNASVAVGMVADDEQSAKLPQRLEPWLADAEAADLYALIEDELLLALPMIALHPPAECPGASSYATGAAVADTRRNPFAVLAQLKRAE